MKPSKRIFNNAKVSDHFAIVPTGETPRNLDEKQEKIFDMVARRFIAVFYPPAQFEVTTRITTVAQEKFKTEGKIIVDPGWLAVYGRQAEGEDSDKAIVAVRPGEAAETRAIEVKESETKPPARFNEATMLSAMEGAGKLIDDEELREAMTEKGLGTPATRASIIEGLIYEGYMDRQGRDLIATAKGISLITLLRNLKAETLCKPELTGEWESKLKRMERGELGRPEFMTQIRDLTSDLVNKVKQFGGGQIEGDYHPLEVPCPRCKGGPFKEDFRMYECEQCGLRVWKKLADREFERAEVETLLTTGKVGPLTRLPQQDGTNVRRRRANRRSRERRQDGQGMESNLRVRQRGLGAERSSISPQPSRSEIPRTARIYETETAYVCQPAGDSAKPIRMGKSICQRAIPVEQALKIFREGKTDLLPKFISKKGKPFSAFLKLDGGKVIFEFEPRAKKKPAPKKPAKAGSLAPKAG